MANHGLLLTADWNRKDKNGDFDGMFEPGRTWKHANHPGKDTDADKGKPLLGGDGSTTIQFCVNVINNPDDAQVTMNVMCTASRNGYQAQKSSPFRDPDDDPQGAVLALISEDADQACPFDNAFTATSPYTLYDDGQGKGHKSTYELSIVAEVTVDGDTKQFAYDPDMDVDNGSTDPLIIQSS